MNENSFCYLVATDLQIYVGQTKRQLSKRLFDHFRDIETVHTNKSIGQHFSNANNHRGIMDVKFTSWNFQQWNLTTDSDLTGTSAAKSVSTDYTCRHFPRSLNTEDECRGPGGNFEHRHIFFTIILSSCWSLQPTPVSPLPLPLSPPPHISLSNLYKIEPDNVI